MIERAEIQRSLGSAWAIFRGKPDAIRGFDISAEGFWRSFQVILLLFPAYLVVALNDRQILLSDAVPDYTFNEGAFWLAEVFTIAVDWVAFPILLAAIAGFIGIKRDYAAFIVARNWATPIIILPSAAVSLLDLIGVFSPEFIAIPWLAALVFALRFSYLIVRAALHVRIDVAIGIVALDFLLSLALIRVIGLAFGVTP